MREFRNILFAVALLTAFAVYAEDPQEALRLQEKKIAASLTGKSNPLPTRKAEVTLEQLKEADDKTVARLNELPIHFVKLTPDELKKIGTQSALQRAIAKGSILRAPEEWDLDEAALIYRVKSMTPRTAPESTSLWDHPETPALIKKIYGIGYRLQVDSTVGLTGAAGVTNITQKVIQVSPNYPLSLLAHEATHAKWNHFEIPKFIKTAKEHPALREHLIKQKPYLGFGEGRLRQVLELLDRGYPVHSINEAIAITEQLRAEAKSDGHPIDVKAMQHGTIYAMRNLIHDLTNIARARPLTFAERNTYVECLLHRIANSKVSDERSALKKDLGQYVQNIREASGKDYALMIHELQRASIGSSSLLGINIEEANIPEAREKFNRYVSELDRHLSTTKRAPTGKLKCDPGKMAPPADSLTNS